MLFVFLVAICMPLSLAQTTQSPCPKPEKCGKKQMACPAGGQVVEGCPMPSFCQDMRGPIRGKDKKKCWNHCPINDCGAEVFCDLTFDSNGCPMPQVCMAKKEECPPSQFDEQGCEVNPTCATDQFPCAGPPPTDKKSPCGPVDSCFPMYTETSMKTGQQCYTQCPAQCTDKQMACPTGYDSEGCMGKDICVGKKEACPEFMFDNMGCTINTPPTCPENEEVCSNGKDENGCELPLTCGPCAAPAPGV